MWVTMTKTKIAAENRKAKHDYDLVSTVEAGIVLVGSEVKSLRNGQASISESYASFEHGELWLLNAYIPEYLEANRLNHVPRRPRKLLLQKRELARFATAVEREGMTLVPLQIRFNERGRAKVELALARGRKRHDKRDADKKRDWEREKARLLRVGS